MVTTRWVLTELANALGDSPIRVAAGRFLQRIEGDASFQIVHDSDGLYERGLALFASRPDKAWSLTDCISFVVMADMDLTEAVTRDRHFEQAGFRALLV
jgi:predicted nucleic acid-binding protein